LPRHLKQKRRIVFMQYGTIAFAASHATAGVPMHLLRLFLAAWIELGIATVFFLYWLVARTARHVNTPDKPVLDQDSFQQLLSAAYSLQEKNRSLVKETKADSSPTVSLLPEPVQIAHSDLEPSAHLNGSVAPTSRNRRMPRSDEFFWRVATAVAMISVFALFLVTSHDRLSPLPAGLEVIQQEVPLRRVLPQSDEVGTKTITMEPQATKTGPDEQTLDAHKPGRSVAAAAHKKIVKPTRHSIYESEADMVAPDTVVRYSRRAVRQ
jgi:hypothetical protein